MEEPAMSEPVEGSESRGPDAIVREIEATRAELADAIDSIAERVNPKRAAARGAQAVKSNSPIPVVPVAALAGFLVVVLLFLRRRRSR
jgi:MYXO-CTERM domain-containing protein